MDHDSTSEPAPEDEAVALHSPAKRVVGAVLLLALLGGAGYGLWTWQNRARAAAEEEVGNPCLDGGEGRWARLHATEIAQAVASDDETAWAAVIASVHDVPRAAEIWRELRENRSKLEPRDADARERVLVDQWNALMTEIDVPWRIALPMNPRIRRSSFVPMTYCLVGESQVSLDGSEPVVVELRSRQDRLALVEGYSGHGGGVDDTAVVLLERLGETIVDEWWPLLASPPDDASDAEVARHQAFRDEARSLLGDAAFDTLARTAAARRTLVEFGATARERLDCGGGLTIHRVPIRGYPASWFLDTREHASPDDRGCPNVTMPELEAAAVASRQLRQTPGIRSALAAWLRYAATTTALHEARHVLDARDGERPCERCDDLDDTARAELSAYATVYATSPAPIASLIDNCGLLDVRGGRQHARAIRALHGAFDDDPCAQPAAIAAQGAAEQHFYGTSGTASWPTPLPAELPTALLGP